ncbi:MAG TPA: bifunctional phosphoribosylaminoimidazolecarboxamide formyltransferase/IMP cyclohydrolase [Pyrinomonadaceae bacterium]
MTIKGEQGFRAIKRALISVSDKNGIADFARVLKTFHVEIISTGGTAKALREAGVEVVDVSDITGFPEMMDGRVKTLHPKIHGALLGLRDDPKHQSAMHEAAIEPIDMVVVNLYPFQKTIANPSVTLDEAIEQIDIGGPAMIRSAAKNFRDVAIVTEPSDYPVIIDEMTRFAGTLSLSTRARLAAKAFAITSEYDNGIQKYLSEGPLRNAFEDSVPADQKVMPDRISLQLQKATDLRYGENPHQRAALYSILQHKPKTGIASAEILSGKEMSFNNYVDAEAAWLLVSDFDQLACAIIKHTNPAGVGLDKTAETAYRKALATDPVSAFGGIVAFNGPVDEITARAVIEIFTEVVIAPQYEPGALDILRSKKNLRVLRVAVGHANEHLECRQISGGMLVQTRDTHKLKEGDLQVVTKRAPTNEEIQALLFAWVVAKHTKSNAIVYARAGQTVGVGAGQMSRVDSVKIGAMRAQLPISGSVLASDAFFPFRDGIDEAAKHEITAIIQPGGSMRDQEVISAADEHGLAMVFIGVRHFKH